MSTEYYQKNKERLHKKAWERFQILSKEEKQRLVEYRNNYSRMQMLLKTG